MDESMDSITLKNNIPIIYSDKSIDLLSKNERQLSKFFKCCSNESIETTDESNKKCFWSGNGVKEYRDHIQSCHKQVFCSYCLSDKTSSDEEIKSFSSEEADQLIEHLIESHGRRVYQCNRCQYRANTLTHIQLHQIAIHYTIWAKYNSNINIDSLDDRNNNICKIIVCKPVTNGPNVDHSVLVPKFSPDLDKDLSENLFYCLFCDYSNEEVMKVFMHCVHKHRDLEVCVYHKECPKRYCFDENESSEESDSDLEEPKEQPNSSKSLVNNFETKLSFDSEPIPGLEDDFTPLDGSSKGHFCAPSRGRPRFYDRFHKRGTKRKQSYDSHFEDEFGDNFTSEDSFTPNNEDNHSISTPLPTHNWGPIQPSMAITPIPRPIATPLRPPIATTPLQPLFFAPPVGQPMGGIGLGFDVPIQPNIRQPTKPKKKKWQKNYKLKENEQMSQMNYGEYRKYRNMTSTPASKPAPHRNLQIPPEIDLQQTQNELGLDSNESGIRNNSFKKINRIGVSSNNSNKSQVTYIPRREDEGRDEYMELLNESRVPKRGVKARFENQSHFELMNLSNPTTQMGGRNLYKCVMCANEQQFREINISLHLNSVHKTDSSFRCGHCQFIGQRAAIISHSNLTHPGAEHKIEKFIVPITQNSSIGFTSGSNLEKSKTTARKSTSGVLNATKGAKGALTQRIRDGIFLGPLKNDVTGRKQSDNHEPSTRVHSRTRVGIPFKKRPKLILSDSESEGEMETENDIPSDVEPQSDVEMHSDGGSAIVAYDSDDEYIVEVPKPKVVSVAKKSTAKPSSQNTSQVSITLTEEEIPTKYFCVFCTDSFIINDLSEAIEHYKSHLKLGYTCGKCDQFFVSYQSMDFHWINVHKTESGGAESVDNMTEFMRQWIIDFLNHQVKSADFAENIVPNSTGINIVCPLCVKAAKVCNSVRPRVFDALWKVKLHICKHLNWFPMKCSLCEDSNIMFPQNPYLLMKHLVDCHFTSCENLYNISFRAQKPYNDMKREQLRLIDKNFSIVNVFSSDIINSFFDQLMTELDLNYENQLKAKYNLSKEIQINVERLVQVKSEPIDDVMAEVNGSQPQSDDKPEVKEDKKDIKLHIKSEFKTEVKSEFKTEVKDEVKTEMKVKKEMEDEELRASEHFISRLYGSEEIPSTPAIRLEPTENAEEITLSSDEEN